MDSAGRAPRAGPVPDSRHVAFRGLRLHVREQGEGAPLLLINGLGANLQMWAVAQDHLSDVARTISFDAPGTGRSRSSPVVLPMPVLARLIGGLLTALGHDRVDVVGYSLGGAVAQQFARSCPERVRRLALVATSCGWGSAPPEAAPLALVATPLRYLSKSFYLRTNHVLDGGARFRDPQLARAQAEARSSQPPSIVGYAQQLLQGATWSSLHWADRLQVPTLVVSGERDRLTPPVNGRLLASLLPHSRLHVLPGEGHLMLFDPGTAALPLLSDFFASPELAASQAWRTGEEVAADERLLEELRRTPGAQPFKVMGAAYRAGVGWLGGR